MVRYRRLVLIFRIAGWEWGSQEILLSACTTILPLVSGGFTIGKLFLSPTEPWNMEFYQAVHIRQDKNGSGFLPTVSINPPLTMAANGLGPIVQANPGSVWMLGNEIDRRAQGETMPDKYAEAYHDTYQFIKGIDPTARIATGSIVQPTPLRLEYLDKILTAYRSKYGGPMPIDVWNIHLYILPELKGSWGAEVPPGSAATQGRLYTAADNVNLNIFKSLIYEMRAWMKSRGYQETPLIITEFGALLPLWWMDDNGVTQEQMNQFNRDTASLRKYDGRREPGLCCRRISPGAALSAVQPG